MQYDYPMRCEECKANYPPIHNYCYICGRELIVERFYETHNLLEGPTTLHTYSVLLLKSGK